MAFLAMAVMCKPGGRGLGLRPQQLCAGKRSVSEFKLCILNVCAVLRW